MERTVAYKPIPKVGLTALTPRARKQFGSPIEMMVYLARSYGPIFEVHPPGGRSLIISSQELVNEICDETRFDKVVDGGVKNARRVAGDGLFTAWTHEENWGLAHRILMPTFSPKAMKSYLAPMLEVARQLVGKWERACATEAPVDVPNDMTRLTLDTIGICGFDYRFDSFSREDQHPFVEAMVAALKANQAKLMQNPIQAFVDALLHRDDGVADQVALMQQTVENIIRERRTEGAAPHQDLLNHMLEGRDAQSGKQLPDENIRNQIITFLVAGHETTSGLLSFALYLLVKNPQFLDRAYQEVDEVLGSDLDADPTEEQLNRLHYLGQILKETLRLYPTAPAFTVGPKEDTVVGGVYPVKKLTPMRILLHLLHRDPKVWPDPERFDPDRFSPEAEAALPDNCYKPFGNGQRACIGRVFALREATLVLGMLLQRFRFVDFANYQLKINSTLTIKPADFHLKLQARPATEHAPRPAGGPATPEAAAEPTVQGSGTIQLLYGSNMGTSEDFAEQVAQDARGRGYQTATLSLDEAVGKLAGEGLNLIFVSSYNGSPPNNAAAFYNWTANLKPGQLQGVRYSIFGCGNHDWAATYQAVPRTLDERLAAAGATRIHRLGEGDAGSDLDSDFHRWYGDLWSAIGKALGTAESSQGTQPRPALYEVEFLDQTHPNPYAASFGARAMALVENRELQSNHSGRSTRHLELVLPEGVSYTTGDHLGVFAHNPPALVERAAARFGLETDTRIRLRQVGDGKAVLPCGMVFSLGTLLGEYLELHDPATRRQIQVLLEFAGCPPDQARLQAMLSDGEVYRNEVLGPNRSLLDLLELCPSCELPLARFLELLPGMRPRYYSISSSPLQSGRLCSLTVGVVEGPARSGRGRFEGVCSTYLAGLPRGAEVLAFVHDTGSAFRLPASAAVPIIMVGAGTGLAPFRGFLQERAALKERGKKVGPALFFFGCRKADHDFLYHDELQAYQQAGLVELIPALSRESESKVYVQDRIREYHDRVWELMQAGANIYVCGDATRMAPEVRQAFATVYLNHQAGDEAAAEAWLRDLETGHRYLADVWASS